ncbi:hypothetical protein GCM10023235_02490 [Kitasatospora terrestris]|uniref:Gram-positive cocci surface proteins LPxTG domain-containing protein n=1 Tax=Kitasatospora terrestris TaxID=258051 RepID=A0ABP9DDA4_9ACTN
MHLRQTLPLTATAADGENCPGIPSDTDGWHFVLPTNDAHFVKLTVSFEPGGQQVLTTFGPPSDKHAYVASAPGARLTAALAEVSGGHLDLFNLSHTCAATGSGSSPSPSPSPSGSPSPSPSPSASPSPSGSASASPSPSPSGSATTSPSPSGGPSPSGSVGSSGSPSPSASGPAGTVPSPTPAVGPSAGGLAFTGADVAGIVVTGASLIGVGAVLLIRRRKAADERE